jgi:hypothetical protein
VISARPSSRASGGSSAEPTLACARSAPSLSSITGHQCAVYDDKVIARTASVRDGEVIVYPRHPRCRPGCALGVTLFGMGMDHA